MFLQDYLAIPHTYNRVLASLSDSEFGRFIRALIEYNENGTPMALTGNERFYVDLAVHELNEAQYCLDCDLANYAAQYHKRQLAKERESEGNEVSSKRSAAGKLGAEKRWNGKNGKTDGKNGKSDFAIGNDTQRESTKENTDNNIYINNIYKGTTNTTTEQYRLYGTYQWVKLTQSQYDKLVTDFGEDTVKDLITKVDEYCQQNGNKNKYKDFNLVIRKAHREHWFERSQFSNTQPKHKPMLERETIDDWGDSDIMNRPRAGGAE